MGKHKNIKIEIRNIQQHKSVNISMLSDYIAEWFDSRTIHFDDLIVEEENKIKKEAA